MAEKQIWKLKLLVDDEKKEIVLVEATKDFIDFLFGYVHLPMGHIVRLLGKKTDNLTPLGCMKNLYQSVLNMPEANFSTEYKRQLLLYPRYLKDRQCQSLKVDDTRYLKFFVCPDSASKEPEHESCAKFYCSFPSRVCTCGKLLSKGIPVPRSKKPGQELFHTQRTSFLLTDNMVVQFASLIDTIKLLKKLGYSNFDKLHQRTVDISHEDGLSLLHCLFTSESPLTDFLLKNDTTPAPMPTPPAPMPTPPVKRGGMASASAFDIDPKAECLSLSVAVNKRDNKVLFAECGDQFVDLLIMFLAIPLSSAWNITGKNFKHGCVNRLCESFHTLSTSGSIQKPIMLPAEYQFHNSLLGFTYELPYILTVNKGGSNVNPAFCSHTTCSEIVSKGFAYLITDDLTIKVSDSLEVASTIEKLNLSLDDIDMHRIKISKTHVSSCLSFPDILCYEIRLITLNLTLMQAIDLLRASLMTSTALTTVLWSLLTKETLEK